MQILYRADGASASGKSKGAPFESAGKSKGEASKYSGYSRWEHLGQGSIYIHDGNLSHLVGGVSGQSPSIGDMARGKDVPRVIKHYSFGLLYTS